LIFEHEKHEKGIMGNVDKWCCLIGEGQMGTMKCNQDTFVKTVA
jgi:hypothetical protein